MIWIIVLVGIGGAGGWYLRGLDAFSRDRDSAVRTTQDHANTTTPSARLGRPEAHETLRRLLSTAQYEEAIARLRSIISDSDFTPVAWASELFLFHARKLEQLGMEDQATHLLQQYLAVVAQDRDAYILLAHLQHRQGRTDVALETLATTPMMVHRQAQDPLLREFGRLLRTYLRQHRQHESDPVDEALLERLVQELPQYEPLYLELARHAVQLGDLDMAAQWLQEVDPHGTQALQRERLERHLERQFEAVSEVESRVALQKSGRHYTVDVTMINGYDEVDFRLLIDTGASLTLLTPEAAARLGIVADHIERRQRLVTPGGLVDAPIYQIEALAVGQEIVWDLPIAIVPLGTEAGLIDGLIGMDFLGHFNFNIDQGNQELKLTPQQ
jgi:clan AA aspartic protease (TIGR02281 family)